MENFFTEGFNVWILIKILISILLGMYILFAFVLTRQVKLMTRTLQLGFEAPVKFLSFMHLVFAILVFFAALTIL
jgi:hypothetical protein